MSRRFRLAAVERMRSGALAEAAGALAAARRELIEAITRRDRIRKELAVTVAARKGPPVEYQAAAARRQRLRDDLTGAAERCVAAYEQELATLAAWNAARAELRAVEVLHERHRAALAEADARAEQREIDEFAALTHRRRSEGDSR
ncbi:MAG: flagellar export protein FliJ [Actinomycetota bacterium]|nr:flagellar export protein FliJ [Actinomycetota bacterium]